MAGIGFDLKRLLNRGSAQSTLSAYFYTALVTAGPWLFSVLSLSLMSLWGGLVATQAEVQQFIGLAIYAFCVSMILTGGSQIVVTRYISDRFYGQEDDLILGILTESWLLTIGINCLFGIPGLIWLGMPLETSLISFILLLLTSLMWMTMVFVSALKAYLRIVWTFVLGFTLAIPGSLFLAYFWGLNGFLIGLTGGITLIVFLLAGSIFLEFRGNLLPQFVLLQAHQEYWILFLTGFVASLGIWADKILLWYYVGEKVIAKLQSFPLYDGAIFIAYLTVIPSMAYFVMVIETDFYEGYRRYFQLVEKKVAFISLEYARKLLNEQVQISFLKALLIQIVITSVMIFMSPWIITALHMDWQQWHIFRIGCMASFLHMTFSLLNIILSYFDAQAESLLANLVYLITLIFGTWWSTQNFWFFGYGYLIAGVAATLISLPLVLRRLKELHYYTLLYPKIHT